MREPEERHWNGTQRSDGVAVVVTATDTWIVIPKDGPPLTSCPCCVKPFATKRSAMLVADALYPMKPPL